MPQRIFDEFVFIMKSALLSENKLLGSYYNSKELMKKMGMNVKNIECMLYYKDTFSKI